MDIIGFNEQIGVAKVLNRARQIVKKVAPKPVATRPVAARPVATRPVAARPVAPKPVATRPVAARPVATRPVAAKPVATRPVAKGSFVKRVSTMPVKPAQVPFKMTAKTTTSVKPTSKAADKAPMAIVKPSGQSIPVSTLEQTTSPKIVQSVSPTQRSFMPVDLPYKTTKSFSKNVRIVNTPYSYNVNTDLIEPSVDSGIANYYGK